MMNYEFFAATIQTAYDQAKYKGGWSMFYTDVSTLLNADVVFIGLNPGGDAQPGNYRLFMETGQCAYFEKWTTEAGQSRLQKQIRALFEQIGIEPAQALCGNIVPFRSKDWRSLPNPNDAMEVGYSIWREVYKKPRLVTICMGREAQRALIDHILPGPKSPQEITMKWGKAGIKASICAYEDGVLIHLPHLSRYTVCTRAENKEDLKKLLAPVQARLLTR